MAAKKRSSKKPARKSAKRVPVSVPQQMSVAKRNSSKLWLTLGIIVALVGVLMLIFAPRLSETVAGQALKAPADLGDQLKIPATCEQAATQLQCARVAGCEWIFLGEFCHPVGADAERELSERSTIQEICDSLLVNDCSTWSEVCAVDQRQLPLDCEPRSNLDGSWRLDQLEHGIRRYDSGSLSLVPNRYGGVQDNAEIGVTCPDRRLDVGFGPMFVCEVTVDGDTFQNVNVGSGVAVHDQSSYNGYVMYSQVSLSQRFSLSPVRKQQGENLVAVCFRNGQWYYDNDRGCNVPFDPLSNDFILAKFSIKDGQIVSLSDFRVGAGAPVAGDVVIPSEQPGVIGELVLPEDSEPADSISLLLNPGQSGQFAYNDVTYSFKLVYAGPREIGYEMYQSAELVARSGYQSVGAAQNQNIDGQAGSDIAVQVISSLSGERATVKLVSVGGGSLRVLADAEPASQCVRTNDLLAAISQWRNDDVTTNNLLNLIQRWRTEEGCN